MTLKDDIVSTDIYCKAPDSHNYLNFYSNHSKHVKVNIPFNSASRIITIVSDKDVITSRLHELTIFLKAQWYPNTIIENGIRLALQKGPFTSRTNTDNGTKILPFISTFNPHNFNIFPVIRNKCEDLKRGSTRMKSILNKQSLMHSIRQPIKES